MTSVEQQIKELEDELLALAGNQAPAPSQIATFSHTVPITDSFETHTAFFAGGPRIFQSYLTASFGFIDLDIVGNNVNIDVFASAGSTLTVVSLSEFTLA